MKYNTLVALVDMGEGDGTPPPHPTPIFLDFMQFFGKFDKNHIPAHFSHPRGSPLTPKEDPLNDVRRLSAILIQRKTESHTHTQTYTCGNSNVHHTDLT